MSNSTVLKQIISEFGSREEAIELAYRSCDSFRTLCGDYVACSRARAGFRRSDSKEARLREVEYSELLQELAAEIRTRLCAVESVPGLRCQVPSRGGQSELG